MTIGGEELHLKRDHDAGNPNYISSLPRVGYRMARPETSNPKGDTR